MDSLFQMRFGEDAYPISRFLVDRAQALRLTRSDLARRLGYRNIGSAHKALAETLTTGKVPCHMWSHLAQAPEIDQSILDAVIKSTTRQQQDEWRAWLLDWEKEQIAHFRPHLRTETTRTVPEPIFIAALIGTARLRLIELPSEVWDVSAADRNQLVKQAIQNHYRAHKANVVPFGAILSYTLVTLPGYLADFGYPFDTNGDPAGPMQEVKRLGGSPRSQARRRSADRVIAQHRDRGRAVTTNSAVVISTLTVCFCAVGTRRRSVPHAKMADESECDVSGARLWPK